MYYRSKDYDVIREDAFQPCRFRFDHRAGGRFDTVAHATHIYK